MRKQTEPEFVVVANDKVREITQELSAGNGIVLIADPKYCGLPADRLWGEFRIHLYDRPIIDPETMRLKAPRGTRKVGNREHQTGWERDREYRLFEKPRRQAACTHLGKLYEQADGLFNRLSVGSEYLFEIHMQACAGYDLSYSRCMALYVPRTVSPRAGFMHALSWMTGMWNAQKPLEGWPKPFQFTSEHLELIIVYALKDLETGTILAHNVSAGMDADAFVGLA